MTKEERVRYYDSVAAERKKWRRKGAYYHGELERYLQLVVPPGASVIEIGCGSGELLNALRPARGLGIDISPGMVDEARKNFPHLRSRRGTWRTSGSGRPSGRSSWWRLSDTSTTSRGPPGTAQGLRPPDRVILVSYNYLWEPSSSRRGHRARMKQPLQHWLPMTDLANLLFLAISRWYGGRARSSLRPVPSSPLREPRPGQPALIGRLCLNGILIARP